MSGLGRHCRKELMVAGQARGLTPFSLSLQDYPKLSQSYYSLLEVLTQDHMNFIASLEPHVIMYILSSISEGLTALGNSPCSLVRS